MALIETRFRVLFLALFAVFIVFGTSMTIIGATLPIILGDFHWSYLAAGLVLAAGSVAYFVATFAAGHLVKGWGPKPTIALALALGAIGLTFFAATPFPLVNALLSALIGLGQGGVEIGVNCLTLRIDYKKTGRPMNLMHGAFAVGAIAGPLTVALLIENGFNWVAVYRALAVIFALLGVLMLFVSLPGTADDAADDEVTPNRLRANPAYWLSFLALFFYVGVELGVSNWLAEYFVVVFDTPASASAWLVSLFWIGLLAGRFGFPLLYRGSRQDVALVAFSALATVAIVLLSLLGCSPQNAATNAIGKGLVFLAGLGCSIYYPAVITLLGRCFPREQGRAVGFAATGGGVGAFVFPFTMAALAQNWGIRAGFATYGVLAVAMTVAAWWLARIAAQGED